MGAPRDTHSWDPASPFPSESGQDQNDGSNEAIVSHREFPLQGIECGCQPIPTPMVLPDTTKYQAVSSEPDLLQTRGNFKFCCKILRWLLVWCNFKKEMDLNS